MSYIFPSPEWVTIFLRADQHQRRLCQRSQDLGRRHHPGDRGGAGHLPGSVARQVPRRRVSGGSSCQDPGVHHYCRHGEMEESAGGQTGPGSGHGHPPDQAGRQPGQDHEKRQGRPGTRALRHACGHGVSVVQRGACCVVRVACTESSVHRLTNASLRNTHHVTRSPALRFPAFYTKGCPICGTFHHR